MAGLLEEVKMHVDIFNIWTLHLTRGRCNFGVFGVFCTKGLIFLTKYVCYSKFKGLIWNPRSSCILPPTLILRPTFAALIVSTNQIWSSTKLGHTDDAFGNNPGDVNVCMRQTAQPVFFFFLYRWVWKHTRFSFQTIDPCCQVQSRYLGSRNGWTWLVTPAPSAIKGN